MSTSIKIDEEDKEKLERLQAMITLKTRKKASQQEILSAIISDAYARGDEFIEKKLETYPP